MDDPLALRLFQNDCITSFKLKKIIYFLFQFRIMAGAESDDESGGAKVAAPKSPIPRKEPSDADIHTFCCNKLQVFQKFMVCPHGQGV